ncbi:ComEC/Rec2 family competence protein [Phaeovulum sp. W22_SRMD_FR3]|uniref:ComEC/Rec2 family competence protein n=1 Tax=Phaeovulum sp. W22_SRMD_FR3 TaxID=3240274 RepID=UPI003F9BC133
MALFADPEEDEGAAAPGTALPGLPGQPVRGGAMARAWQRLRVWAAPQAQARRGGWLLSAPVVLACGIGTWFALPVEPGALSYAAAVAGILLGVALFWRGWRVGHAGAAACGFAVAVLALGFVLAGARAHLLSAPVLGFRYFGPVEGRVVELDRSSRDRLRLTLDQVVLRDVAPERRPARLRVALERPELAAGVVPGQRVMLTALLSPPAGPAEPGGYDFRRNAWFDRLGAVGFARAPVLSVAPPDPADHLLAGHRLRMRLSAAMQAAMPGQPGAVAAALMTGDRSAISEATNAAMRAANLYHIVSISGLHMGMLTGFVFAMLRYGLALAGPLALYWPAKKIAALVALAAASLYLWISGAEVATERAYVMVAVMLLAVLADRRAISLRSVALAALVILLRAPESLVSPGFQMSFAATVALIVIYPPAARLVARLPVLLRPPVLLVLSSLAAGMSTAPIAAAHFHRMAEYGLVANLAAVPVMGVLVMPAGVVAALLAPFGLAAPALWVMAEGTRWMIFVAATVAGWSGAVRVVATPGPLVLPLLALGATMVLLASGRRLVQLAGLVGCLTAFVLWGREDRPLLLIAEAGDLVGLMTAEGRAMSKTGAAFVAESWLEADGDGAAAGVAAARAGFAGPRGQRRAEAAGWEIWHLTGKAAPAHLAKVCRPGALVVLGGRLTPEDREGAVLMGQILDARSGEAAGLTMGAGAIRGAEPPPVAPPAADVAGPEQASAMPFADRRSAVDQLFGAAVWRPAPGASPDLPLSDPGRATAAPGLARMGAWAGPVPVLAVGAVNVTRGAGHAVTARGCGIARADGAGQGDGARRAGGTAVSGGGTRPGHAAKFARVAPNGAAARPEASAPSDTAGAVARATASDAPVSRPGMSQAGAMTSLREAPPTTWSALHGMPLHRIGEIPGRAPRRTDVALRGAAGGLTLRPTATPVSPHPSPPLSSRWGVQKTDAAQKAGPLRLRAGCLVYDQVQLAASGAVALRLAERAVWEAYSTPAEAALPADAVASALAGDPLVAETNGPDLAAAGLSHGDSREPVGENPDLMSAMPLTAIHSADLGQRLWSGTRR